MKRMLKNNYKSLISFLLGGLILGGIGVYSATILASSEVSYDNSKSGGNSTNVQEAVEELYEKSNQCTTGSCSLTESNFFVAYTYNQTKGANNYCVTGNEATCVRTDCYTSSTKTCPQGTIIDYIVSGTNTKVRFHVIYDKGKTITMQSQKHTIGNTAWGSPSGSNQGGPSVVLPKLEAATKGWTNVEDQTYTMGTTSFLNDNFYTGCKDNSDYTFTCDKNTYLLAPRTAKARLITMQEVASTGCLVNDRKSSQGTCPIFMYNYLYQSTLHGGTENITAVDNSVNFWGYWTMSAYSPGTSYIWLVDHYGWTYYNTASYSSTTPYSARAVITVKK